jgi:hypothetical protein
MCPEIKIERIFASAGLAPDIFQFQANLKLTDVKEKRMSGRKEKATVVLVHGAWAGGSSWGDVIAPLQSNGLDVLAAPIPADFPAGRCRCP